MKLSTPGIATTIRPPVERLLRPFQAFIESGVSGGLVLLIFTITALVWMNSPYAESYRSLLHIEITLGIDRFRLTRDLHFWINEALMTIFFFVVGLEIKRELLVGELASPRRAALPILAAVGGAAAPAVIYLLLNAGGPGANGWGIPMATDIAFVLGVMAIAGKSAPVGLHVFLVALAIVDDILAVLVIAIFYTSHIEWSSLVWAAYCMALLAGANRLGVRHPMVYGLLGALLWITVLKSGIHATVAGVALALTVPTRTWLDARQFLGHGRRLLDHFERAAGDEKSIMNDEEQQVALKALEEACEKVQTPLLRMEHALHPWVTFAILPLFALANAGVAMDVSAAAALAQPVSLGIIAGLLLGKPLGITAAAYLAVRTGLASLPADVSWRQIHAAGWIAGIGFTMSLFLADLAFQDEARLRMAKTGILAASAAAGLIGAGLLLAGTNRRRVSPAGSARA